mgnify:CR=1 FL=1
MCELCRLVNSHDPTTYAYLAYISAKQNIPLKTLINFLRDEEYIELLKNPRRTSKIRALIRMGLLSLEKGTYMRSPLGIKVLNIAKQLEKLVESALSIDEKQIQQMLRNHVDNQNYDRLFELLFMLSVRKGIRTYVDNQIANIRKLTSEKWGREHADIVLEIILDLWEYEKYLSDEQLSFLATWVINSVRMTGKTDKLRQIINKMPRLGDIIMRKLIGGEKI